MNETRSSEPGPATVVIADDHLIVRNGLRELLTDFPGVTVVAEAENGLEAIALARKHKPTLMLLDVGLPLANGAEVFADVRRWSPQTRVAVLTGFTAVGMLADWIASGVDGLFLKSCAEDELRKGLRVLLAGGTYVAEDVVHRLKTEPTPDRFTPREREVLSLIASGLTTAQIGDRLSISPKTVEKHRAALMEKFGVGSVAALLSRAFRDGLLDHLSQS